MMMTDILIQVALLLLTLGMFFALQNIPKQAVSKIRLKTRSNSQVKSHFVQGAQLLARARSARNKTTSLSLSKDAIEEANKAISLDPRDAAAHILKALTLDFQGHHSSALKSLDAALSSPVVKSLSGRERGDALFKRAELQIAVNRRRRTDSALSDLLEAVKLCPDNAKAFCLLGQCYERKGIIEEARKSYEDAMKVEPYSAVAREGLYRLAVEVKEG